MTPSRRRRTARIGAIALLAASILGLIWGGRIWAHPTLLANTSALGNGDVTSSAGEVHLMGVAGAGVASREDVTLRKVEAHFATNTAGVKASFFVCRISGNAAAGSGRGPDAMSDTCSSLRPVEDGQRLHLSDRAGRDEIVMKLVATRPGKAHVDRVSFSYERGASHLWKRGTEVSQQDWRITAR